jgi:hypothetical protein
MIKILLSASTVCALGAAQNVARADSNQVPSQTPSTQPAPPPLAPQPVVPPPPIPTDTPTPVSPNDPVTNPNPADQPPITDPTVPTTAPPLPPDTTETTTTTTTTTTVVDSDLDDRSMYGYAWHEPALPSGIGVSTIIGGGVAGFTDRTMRNTTSDVGGLWGLKVAIGSHLPLALELGYTGSATNINGLPTGNKGTLIGSTAEAAVRWNILPHFPATPYLFGGVGWQRYDVTQTSVSLSDSGMNDHDNLLVFPMGTGIAYRMNGFVADLRGTFRLATDQNLVLRNQTNVPLSSDFAPMHTWEASAALGYEF